MVSVGGGIVSQLFRVPTYLEAPRSTLLSQHPFDLQEYLDIDDKPIQSP